MKGFLKNWQTTLAGFVAGIATLGVQGATKPDGSINWPAVILAGAFTALGGVAKQHNVTGGTVPVTKEAEARTEGPAAASATK